MLSKYKRLILINILMKIKQHNSKWPNMICHQYWILIIWGSGSGKTLALLNSINNQLDIDKIYFYAKGPYGTKLQFLISKRESKGLKYFMIVEFLLNTQMICQIFIKILKKYNIDKNVKYS